MKKQLQITCVALITFNFQLITHNSFAQSVGINADGTNGDSNTMLDIKGTDNSSSSYGLKVKDNSANDNFVIRNDGNVGIGTNSPSRLLHIKKDQNAPTEILMDNQTSGGLSTARILFRSNSSGGSLGSYDAGHTTVSEFADKFVLNGNSTSSATVVSSDNAIEFYSGGQSINEKHMVVAADGNVGIGTSSPQELLQINGPLGASNTPVTFIMSPNINFVDRTWAGIKASRHTGFFHKSQLEFQTTNSTVSSSTYNATTKMLIDSDGNVGIGTSSPDVRLHVIGTIKSDTTTPTLEWYDSDAAADNKRLLWRVINDNTLRLQAINDLGGGGGSVFDYVKSGNELQSFQALRAGVSWFTIENTTARVGIGTASPSSSLHVSSAADTKVTIEADSDNVGESDNPEIFFSQDGGANHAFIAMEGLAGTKATSTLDNAFLVGSEDNVPLQLVSADAVGVTLATSGNLGVGTTTPSVSLDVNGTIRGTVIQATTNGAGAFQYNTTTNMTVPDYVFETYFDGNSRANPVYEFLSIEQLERFVKRHNHLPRIPSRKEINKDGVVNTQAISMLNLEKTEEMALYIIELNNKIKEQESTIQDQNKKIEDFESRMKHIERQLKNK